MLKRFIEQLSIDMGFEQPLEANESGSYALHLEPSLDISLRELDRTILFHTIVGKLPQQNAGDFLFKVMVANLLGRETGGAALGIDKDEKELLLIDFLTDEQDYKVFHERLERFANYAEAWHDETRDFGH